MVPYILLILIPTLFTFFAVDRHTKPSRIRIGSNRNSLIENNNPALPVFFIILLVMLMFCHETIGRDLKAYKFYFEIYPTMDLQYFDFFREESLYRLLNWGIGQLTDNYQVFIAVTSVLTVIPIAILYCEERQYSYTKIIVFVGMTTFMMMFSGVRQIIAVALGTIAYLFTRKKKFLLVLLIAVIAYGFHHSAFMILLIYPLYHARFKKNHLWFIVPALAVVFVFNRQIFAVLQAFMLSINDRYDYAMSGTGAYMSLILFGMFAAFAYLVADESKMNDEMIGLRNYLLFAVFMQCFAPVHTLAMRLNYYFIIFIPLAVSKMLSIPRPGLERVAKWARMIIPLYFTYDFFSMLYTSYMSGSSLLDTVPYRFFWN